MSVVAYVAVFAEQHGVQQRLGQLALVVGHGDQHAQLFANAFGFAEDDFEHCTVHRVVLPVEHGAAHLAGLLAEAVNPALALFVTRWVPAQVVVHNGREQALKVDAFREAVGSDQDSRLVAFELLYRCLAFSGCQFAGHGLDRHVLELGTQKIGKVVRRGDVAAKDHGSEALFQQPTDVVLQLR